jgi:hypothetical protein
MHLGGLMILLGGMLAALFFCVRRWDKGPIYKYLPPAYGLVAGIVLALWWRTPSTPVVSSLETAAAFAAAGWVFWFAVWAEKRGQPD